MKINLILLVFFSLLPQAPKAAASDSREIIEKLTQGYGIWGFTANARGRVHYPYSSTLLVRKGIEFDTRAYFTFRTRTNFLGEGVKTYEAEYRDSSSAHSVADNEVVLQHYSIGNPTGRTLRCKFDIINLEMTFECNREHEYSSPWIIGSWYEEFRREDLQSTFISQP